MALLGIDFGTAHVRVATVAPNGQPRAADVVVSPAIVAFGPSGVAAGDPVRMTVGSGKDTAVSGIKRLLGRPADDPAVRAAAERRGLRAVSRDQDLVLEPEDVPTGEAPSLRLIDGVTQSLRYATEQATGKRGKHEAVIALPSWFGEPQLRALAQAARGAQIKVLRFIRDTVATAMWLVVAHGKRGKLVVVDVGAGGMSCSLATATERTLQVELSRGTVTLGGDDVDAELVAAATMTGDPRTWELRRQTCETIKRALVDQDSAERELALDGKPSTIAVERWELDLVMSGMVAVVQEQCRQLLDEAGWLPAQLDMVVSAGGMSLLPAVAKQLETSFGRRPERAPEGLNVVALGAALQAAVATLQAEGVELIDGEQAPPEPPSKPSPASGQGPALSGQVTTTRKTPVRFRPVVTQSRRRPSLRASSDSHPPGGAMRPSSAPPSPSPTPSPVGTQTGAARSAEAAGREATTVTTPPATADAPPAADPSGVAAAPSPPPPPASSPSAGPERGATESAPAAAGSSPPATLRSGDASHVEGGTARDEDRARRRAAAARFASAPPGSRSSGTPGPRGSGTPLPTRGTIIAPRSARDVLTMALTRPLTPQDLDPVYLPVLFRRVLSRRDAQGQVHIKAPGYELEFALSGGNGSLDKVQHAKLLQAFDLPTAEWQLSKAGTFDRKSEFHPLARLALAGVRRIVRTLQADELEDAWGERLDRAAQIRPDRLAVPRRLGLGRRELRFLDRYVDGATSARRAAHEGGLGPSTALQLLALLELYGVLDWSDVCRASPAAGGPREDDLVQLASKLERANHFDVMQVHWSATDRELDDHKTARLAEFADDSEAGRVAPAACQQIRARIERAYAVLHAPASRVAYRNEVYGDIDFEAARDLAATRSAALAMRGDAIEARKDELAAEELARSIPAKGSWRPSTRPQTGRPGPSDDEEPS